MKDKRCSVEGNPVSMQPPAIWTGDQDRIQPDQMLLYLETVIQCKIYITVSQGYNVSLNYSNTVYSAVLLYLETIVDLLHSHVDGPLVIGAVCNVDVLAAVTQSVRVWHPLNDACLLCQRNHCKPATGKTSHTGFCICRLLLYPPCSKKLTQGSNILVSVQSMSRLYTAMMIQDVDHRQHELHKCAQWEVLVVSDKEDEEDRRLSLPVIAAQAVHAA